MILIACSSDELLARWEQALQGIAAVRTVREMDSLGLGLERTGPQVLLLDIDSPGFSDSDTVFRLRTWNPTIRIVVLSGPISDDMELALFKAGARGCCRRDIDPQLLKRVVLAVQIGELWIRRSLTPRLLDELGASLHSAIQSRRATVGRLAYLTRREQEIAALIANGGTNKQIAQQLAISERTVKAHLTEIFRKLGIADRLKLALLVAGLDND
jgi:DNA-binding NarL/FixJ family response regulator